MSSINPAGMSMLAQLTTLLKVIDYKQILKKYDFEKGIKGFPAWDHVICNIYAQIAGSSSLREVIYSLSDSQEILNHLNLSGPPNKSSLAYANGHRSWLVFHDIFHEILKYVYNYADGCKKKFSFKSPLFSIDSTTIELCAKSFNWAKYKSTKGGIKVHVMISHEAYLPYAAVISNAKDHDVVHLEAVLADASNLPKGSMLTFDRGYVDYELFLKLCDRDIDFVTRAKTTMAYKVVKEFVVPGPKGRPKKVPEDKTYSRPLRDEIIEFTSPKAKKDFPGQLRQVVYYDVDYKRVFYFLTNNFRLAATTIAAIYQDRWAIENFFKVVKQNLQIKTFLGTSENAVRIQIWSAMIAILLFKYLQLLSQSEHDWAMSILVSGFRLKMFNIKSLDEWLQYGNTGKPPPPKGHSKSEGNLFDQVNQMNAEQAAVDSQPTVEPQ